MLRQRLHAPHLLNAKVIYGLRRYFFGGFLTPSGVEFLKAPPIALDNHLACTNGQQARIELIS